MKKLIEEFEAAKLMNTNDLIGEIESTVYDFRGTLGTIPVDQSKKAQLTMKYDMLIKLLEKRNVKMHEIITLYP